LLQGIPRLVPYPASRRPRRARPRPSIALAAPAKPDPALHDQALDLLTKGIAFRTVIPGDQVPVYAEFLKGVLVKSGFKPEDIKIEPVAGSATLTARYAGTDPKKKPIVIIDHMDVVEAKAADWTRDPFKPVVENGYIYGRGAVDDKFDVSMVVTVLGKLKREGWKPGRDVILTLSGDEETLMQTARKLAQDWKGAEMVLNGDGGGGLISEEGKPVYYGLQAAEKTYADFTIVVTNPGGHSSRPGKTNAIYQLAQDLSRLDAYKFPVMTNEITAAAFKATAPTTPGPRAMRSAATWPIRRTRRHRHPVRRSGLRRPAAHDLRGDHAERGACAQRPTATRRGDGELPHLPRHAVRRGPPDHRQGDRRPEAKVIRQNDGSIDAPASPLRPDVMAAVTKAVHARYPGLPIVPSMSAGATDSMFFRALGVPAYGVAGLFMKSSDDFSHGSTNARR
jgi:acetylornithine deacetylase/succinyl-diaminopimelate desuccinylase-like protein